MTTALEFHEAPLPNETPSDVPVVTDEAPATSHELTCRACGVPLTYGGRGRKPVYCDEHKRSSSKTSGTRRVGKKNEELAAAATEALVQMNSLVAVALMLGQFNMTAAALAERETVFREQAYAALLTDPALCQQILRGGQASAKVSLAVAYAGLGAAVAPMAVMEMRERKAVRETQKATEAGEWAEQ